MKRMFAVMLTLWSCSVCADEIAYTVRATPLQEKPYLDAKTLATLEPRSRVTVLSRQASWMKIQSGNKTGWVKMLSLQFSSQNKQKPAGSGLRALFNVAAGGGGSVTTGVRGLSEEKLKNARPDPQAVQTMHGYAASKADAQKFARSGSLRAMEMDYLAAPDDGGEK